MTLVRAFTNVYGFTIQRQSVSYGARKPNLFYVKHRRQFASSKRSSFRILGIETSCDDTGVAIVNSERQLLGDAIHNQNQIHLENGGILPPVAGFHHRANMEPVANQAFTAAGLTMSDIDAVAATIKPEVGMKYGTFLCKKWKKPFIPIHHMEAHALTARMVDENVRFPFLVLLISGGHCLLALVEGVDSFLLLGKSMDIAPGEVFDKFHRQLKLRNIAELSHLSGGHAVEVMARKATNPVEFKFEPFSSDVTCDFFFSGMVTKIKHFIAEEEVKYGTTADGVIESAPNLCAAMQLSITKHLCRRVERAMLFLERKSLIPSSSRSLVVSGGVAANKFIANGLKLVCDNYNYHLSVPPPKLCNDNGVMIAWNGVERYRENVGILKWNQLDDVQVSTKCPLGKDIRQSVKDEKISRVRYVKLKGLV
ncbi:probable tRNA N6-adenosine threonylcarbamoyltransferase, mitochondrial isoform X2 [Thrips palmi]|uniref:N(6)-L-threonylcarbamoyladenine synthase n=1 Tax=Thrips palmi TaxID=161013 RepID=A0A6P8ZY89_THRPL|nr:probable tRNA N6-adenosine threonylcarbamoyltransferase, mitochondrial isoform X2 [Thrips palmi]